MCAVPCRVQIIPFQKVVVDINLVQLVRGGTQMWLQPLGEKCVAPVVRNPVSDWTAWGCWVPVPWFKKPRTILPFEVLWQGSTPNEFVKLLCVQEGFDQLLEVVDEPLSVISSHTPVQAHIAATRHHVLRVLLLHRIVGRFFGQVKPQHQSAALAVQTYFWVGCLEHPNLSALGKTQKAASSAMSQLSAEHPEIGGNRKPLKAEFIQFFDLLLWYKWTFGRL